MMPEVARISRQNRGDYCNATIMQQYARPDVNLDRESVLMAEFQTIVFQGHGY